jgi:hypothetical protein
MIGQPASAPRVMAAGRRTLAQSLYTAVFLLYNFHCAQPTINTYS